MKVLPKILKTLELPGCQGTIPEIKQPYHLSSVNCGDEKQHTLPSESHWQPTALKEVSKLFEW